MIKEAQLDKLAGGISDGASVMTYDRYSKWCLTQIKAQVPHFISEVGVF